jgi:biopolymer transport protein ExbD
MFVLDFVRSAGIQRVAIAAQSDDEPLRWTMKIYSPIPRRRTRIVIIPLIDIMFFLLASFMSIWR